MRLPETDKKNSRMMLFTNAMLLAETERAP